ncbi:hypothetical protein [Nostoc sp. 'Lobaria pulmonaria (5183) cyanobiont']|uniref:hypothetical protein n=1 Tax=Nostoc sp. 'Lobaria pulmonaria (5183) cyanobiont' TaxID=1618022 RepID=UPI000CF31763|nr:hypothetical protein [Nostoc sp. 'Lobaria pulmonaria (5183) cyanobiont']
MTQFPTKLTGVPRTMLMTTRVRVDEHQRQVGALFCDPKVFEWWQAIAPVLSLVQENYRYPHRLNALRWIRWIAKLPYFRNASLILETKVLPLSSG